MAERRGSGLSFGQLITLTFGFLLASVVIFVFGLWVGRDLAEQQTLRERQAMRVPLGPPPTAPPPAPTYPPRPPTSAARPTTVQPAAAPTAPPRPTATSPRLAAATPTAASAAWTVQAYATNDTMRAIMLARTLRGKGYDAETATRQIGGATWYTVRVGRFRDRAAAKAMEERLRREEGLEAASVIAP